MSWSEDNKELYNALKAFIQRFQDRPGSLHTFLSSQTVSDYLDAFKPEQRPQMRAALVLLAGCLNQGIRSERLFNFLEGLVKKYGSDLFGLPAPQQADLQRDVTHITRTKYWEIKDQVPGIIWSVGDFIRKNDCKELIQQKSYDAVIQKFSTELFYMGAHSETKIKAKRAYNWLALPSPVGIGLHSETKGELLEIFIGEQAHRFMCDFGPLKGRKRSFPNPEERIRYYKSFYHFLVPGFPQLVEHVFYFLDETQTQLFRDISDNETKPHT